MDEISIHVPREGHDMYVYYQSCTVRFQSTCPARGTTKTTEFTYNPIEFQSTCPARGTTVVILASGILQGIISIHVPREGHDTYPSAVRLHAVYFNPRAPRGARREVVDQYTVNKPISIHVPREGHDSKHAQFFRADLRKSYKYPAERDALPTKNVCKHIKTLG